MNRFSLFSSQKCTLESYIVAWYRFRDAHTQKIILTVPLVDVQHRDISAIFRDIVVDEGAICITENY